MPSIGFTDKCGAERNQALPRNHGRLAPARNCIHARPSAETQVRDWFGQGERRILRRLRGSQTLRTEARAPAIKMPARREKGDTMETQWAQRVEDWATWTSGRGIASLSSAPLQLAAAAAVYQPRRGAISFALSRMSEQKAHSKLETPLAFHSTSFSTFDLPSVPSPSRLHQPAVTGRYTSNKCFEMWNFHDLSKMLVRLSNLFETLNAYV